MIAHADLPLERIRELAQDAGFRSAMTRFYERLEARIATHHPVCRNRGLCCRFDDFGHKLYVTPAELAFFLGTVEATKAVADEADACPYQMNGLCGARAARPMACRIFFCESAGQGWQEDLTESALAELRRLHARFGLPYVYAEWRHALSQLTG